LATFCHFIFSWICTIFFHFFPNKNGQIKKFWNQRNMLFVGGGGWGAIQLFNHRVSPN
jgi:hypothetical protein